MNNKSLFSRMFKSSEEAVSMLLGLVIVIVVVGLVVNYFQKRRGEVSLPGVVDQNENLSDSVKITPTVTEKKDVSGGGEYSVIKGDNLWKIAVKTTGSGYNWTLIAKANGLKNPGLIFSGQKLQIPKIEPKLTVKSNVTSIAPGTTYSVLRGDSLWKIAVKTYGDGYKWVNIWKTNKKYIRDPDKLEIGMKLSLI